MSVKGAMVLKSTNARRQKGHPVQAVALLVSVPVFLPPSCPRSGSCCLVPDVPLPAAQDGQQGGWAGEGAAPYRWVTSGFIGTREPISVLLWM